MKMIKLLELAWAVRSLSWPNSQNDVMSKNQIEKSTHHFLALAAFPALLAFLAGGAPPSPAPPSIWVAPRFPGPPAAMIWGVFAIITIA